MPEPTKEEIIEFIKSQKPNGYSSLSAAIDDVIEDLETSKEAITVNSMVRFPRSSSYPGGINCYASLLNTFAGLGDMEVVRYLVKNGADVNKVDVVDYTETEPPRKMNPVTIAVARFNSSSLVNFLLDSGGDPTFVNGSEHGDKFLSILLRNYEVGTLKKCEEKGLDFKRFLSLSHILDPSKDVEISKAKFLLDKFTLEELQRDPKYKQFLKNVIKCGDSEVLNFVLEKGVKVEEFTGLDEAANKALKGWNVYFAEFLVKNCDANIDIDKIKDDNLIAHILNNGPENLQKYILENISEERRRGLPVIKYDGCELLKASDLNTTFGFELEFGMLESSPKYLERGSHPLGFVNEGDGSVKIYGENSFDIYLKDEVEVCYKNKKGKEEIVPECDEGKFPDDYEDSDCAIRTVNGQKQFVIKEDRDDYTDAELVSPILSEDYQIKDMIFLTQQANEQCSGVVNETCGFHVHVGIVNKFEAKDRLPLIKQMLLNYIAVEGDGVDELGFPKRSYEMVDYKKELGFNDDAKLQEIIDCDSLDGLMELCQPDGRDGAKVNLEAVLKHGTVEFREHSGTLDAGDILSWAKFLNNLVGQSRDMALGDEGPHIPKDEELDRLKESVKVLKSENSKVIGSTVGQEKRPEFLEKALNEKGKDNNIQSILDNGPGGSGVSKGGKD